MNYTQQIIDEAWTKATIVANANPDVLRKDACGAWIRRDMYLVRNSEYGWEIDHIFPMSKGGTTRKENVRALQWQNADSKGDDYPYYTAQVTADNLKNVVQIQSLTVNIKVRERLSKIYGNA
jgi:hypothetical protein